MFLCRREERRERERDINIHTYYFFCLFQTPEWYLCLFSWHLKRFGETGVRGGPRRALSRGTDTLLTAVRLRREQVSGGSLRPVAVTAGGVLCAP